VRLKLAASIKIRLHRVIVYNPMKKETRGFIDPITRRSRKKQKLVISCATLLASMGQCLKETLSIRDARSTQSANMADDSPHQASSHVRASKVSIESDSIMKLLHLSRFASARPSLIAKAFTAAADVRFGRKTEVDARNLPS
jgi:hypothetical protein